MSVDAAAAMRCQLGRLYVRQTRRWFPMGRQSVADGSGSLYSVAQILLDRRRKKPLLVLEAASDGKRLIRSLEENDLSWATAVLPFLRPTPEDIQAIGEVYRKEGCDSIVALGGGATLNAAKAAAVWTVRPKALDCDRVRRRLRLQRLPVMIALPTVAGTGAESSAWVEFFDQAGNACVLAARAITPAVTVLDPGLLEHTPRSQVAAAGLEGLCLALEAYLTPGSGDREAMSLAAEAVKGILENLEPCWNDGGTPVRRNALLEASRKAGLAASGLGYGCAGAMSRAAIRLGVDPAAAYGAIVPFVLEKYGNYATEKLARLSAYAGVMTGESQIKRASALIRRIEALVFRMGLPDRLEGVTGDMLERIAYETASDIYCLPPVYWPEEKCRRVLEDACASGDRNES